MSELVDIASDEFKQAVREVVVAVLDERRAVSVENCVDDLIRVELEREWTRQNPPNPMGVLVEAKRANPDAYISPEMGVEVLACIERLARSAFNEATRY